MGKVRKLELKLSIKMTKLTQITFTLDERILLNCLMIIAVTTIKDAISNNKKLTDINEFNYCADRPYDILSLAQKLTSDLYNN